MAFYASCDKKDIELVERIFRKEIDKLHLVSDREFFYAKQFLEGELVLKVDDPVHLADNLLEWELSSCAEKFFDFIDNVNNVKKDDLRILNNLTTTFSVLKQLG